MRGYVVTNPTTEIDDDEAHEALLRLFRDLGVEDVEIVRLDTPYAPVGIVYATTDREHAEEMVGPPPA